METVQEVEREGNNDQPNQQWKRQIVHQA
jgi:hypothetical protein